MYFMQESKATYELRPYGQDDNIMLIRIQEREVKTQGLPPTVSQVIMMKKSEIEDLITCLQKMR